MKILILKMEDKNGHYVFLPSLKKETTVIHLPPETNHIHIISEGNVHCIYAINESEAGCFE